MIRKHVIAGIYSASQQTVSTARNEHLTNIPLANDRGQLVQGVNTIISDLARMGVYPSEIGLDLLILAELVYAADTRLSRSTESEDSWTRQIRLVVPVSDTSTWTPAAPLLVRMLNFLTGDLWAIDFVNRPESFATIMPAPPLLTSGITFDKVQLFSGGLDSLIGAIDNIESDTVPLFISHAGDPATSSAQHACFEKLKTAYPDKTLNRLRLWMNIDTSTFGQIPSEDTTRGRSFLFFSIGVIAGTGIRRQFTLEAPENGLIALNVPLDNLRLGALSTHTTHNFYMGCWNELLNIIGVPGTILNPYWAKTKGEMVDGCCNHQVLQEILPDSMSCSSPTKGRWVRGGQAIEHCGYCLPCIIRRASLRDRAAIQDTTTYRLNDLYTSPINTSVADGRQIRSFQVAIKRLTQSPELSKYLIHKSGPLPSDVNELRLLGDVYLRGMEEVDRLLHKVRTEPL
ncbi:MAG: Qat anti-phage system QueC-like protein QatC [Algoriphagus aquaeductus]|uniref:Qat anti-phage system QueC-like protein QatC n=1 Tax=Algoriphagus aquaeductus TaxID=475299 RepID=UPI0039192709